MPFLLSNELIVEKDCLILFFDVKTSLEKILNFNHYLAVVIIKALICSNGNGLEP